MEAEAPGRDETPSRDEIYWTELEFRRLGNLVAESIQSRRWVGDGEDAETERRLLRRRVDGMRRKALRIMHRAELYAKSGHAAWPGLDPTITDAVFLADAYVKTVEDYENAFGEEERRAKRLMRKKEGEIDAWEKSGGELQPKNDGLEVPSEVDLWMKDAQAKAELLGGDGVRRRRKKTNHDDDDGDRRTRAKEDEELMQQHRPVWEQTTSELVSLVGQLKSKASSMGEQIESDTQVLEETDKAVDRNLKGIGQQRENLAAYSRWSSFSSCAVVGIVCLCVIITILVAMFLFIVF